jgi:hypothetical protein
MEREKGNKNASKRLIPRLEESNITGGNGLGRKMRSDRSIKRKEKGSKNESKKVKRQKKWSAEWSVV